MVFKFYNKTYEILEKITNNNYHWPSTRQATTRGIIGVYNVDVLIALSAQVTSLTNMVKVMTTVPTIVNQITEVFCVYCREGHLFDNCLGNPALVNYVGNYNRQNHNNFYLNTYNPRWRQHPNFYGKIIIKMLLYPEDKTSLLNHLDFTNKIKGKEAPTMINLVS